MSDSDSDKSSTTLSLCIDENDNHLVHSSNEIIRKNLLNGQWLDFGTSDSEIEETIAGEKMLGDGSEEDDSLLVIFQDAASTPQSVY